MYVHFYENLPSIFWHSALENCLQKKEKKNYVKPTILNLKKKKNILELEALGRHSSPWLRQIIDYPPYCPM